MKPWNMWASFRYNNENTGVSPYVSKHTNTKNDDVTKVYLGGLIWGTPVTDLKENIYVGSTNKRFYCLGNDLQIKWQHRINNRADALIDSAACLHPELQQVVVPGGDGYLHALDINTGKINWQFHATGATDSMHASGVVVNSFEGNVKYSADGSFVYAGNDNDFFYCIDAKTGGLIWKYKTNMMIWTVPAYMNNDKYVVFGSLDGHVYVFDSKTGMSIAKYDTKAEIKASPITQGNDTIIVWYVTAMV